MKLLVCAHRLEIGGTQTNAIELAAALRDRHGYDVVLFATPGPLRQRVEELGLRLLPAPDAAVHPSPARIRALRAAVRQERPDLLHAWDWWQCLDAYYGIHLPLRVPLLVTDMMMDLTRLLPKAVPTTFGIPVLVEQARAAGRRWVELLLPPVAVDHNAPGAVAVAADAFRQRYALKADDITLVTVSRLSHWMKADSLHRSLAAVRCLGRELPLRLLIVGDGLARAELARQAQQINAELGRAAVTLTGMLVDPRPAYAAADIVIGMGGSALRAMAFGKPVIVVGEQGFALPFDASTAATFYYQGLYGRGDGDPANASLQSAIRTLASQPGQHPALGQYARQFVLRHYALETVSARLAGFCERAVNETIPWPVAALDGLRTAGVYLRERRFLTRSRDPVPASGQPKVGAA